MEDQTSPMYLFIPSALTHHRAKRDRPPIKRFTSPPFEVGPDSQHTLPLLVCLLACLAAIELRANALEAGPVMWGLEAEGHARPSLAQVTKDVKFALYSSECLFI